MDTMRPFSIRIATSRFGVADLPSMSVPQRSVVTPVADGASVSGAGPAWAGPTRTRHASARHEVVVDLFIRLFLLRDNCYCGDGGG